MTSEHGIFDKENQKTFGDNSVTAHYVGMTTLFPPEARALEKLRGMVRGGPIMDIGVGAGRTTPYLLELSTDYVGIDYSADMIAKCRSRFPGVRFEVGDARDLTSYPTGHFGLLMFSLNGIDCVDHSDRLNALSECRRLLHDDGILLFSSHNELWDVRANQRRARRFLGRLKDSIRYFRHLKTLRPIRHPTYGYSYRCERVFGDTQTLILYYITPQAQIRQLQTVGFACSAVFSTEGREMLPDMREESPSPWLYYLARKSDAVQ
jgi:SAM-dependent methyltransferase